MEKVLLNGTPSIRKPDLDTALKIAVYEFGSIFKCLVYARNVSETKAAYLVEAKVAMSDTLNALRLVCELKDWDFKEVVALGEERYLDRVREIESWYLPGGKYAGKFES